MVPKFSLRISTGLGGVGKRDRKGNPGIGAKKKVLKGPAGVRRERGFRTRAMRIH